MKKIYLLLFFIILGISFVLSQKDCNYINALEDLISKQQIQDKNILGYLEDNYSIDNPKIILNPYYINPLSALIIFNTEEKETIEVLVNDKHYQDIEGTSFIIPIIYLREDYNNKITIINSKKEYTYFLKTDKIISTNISMKSSSNSEYLVSSPNSDVKHSIFDSSGNLIWYLDLDSSDFLEEYDDFSFLIGVEETKEIGSVIIQNGIYIIDYLGHIIKRIDTSYGYHHEVVLKDNSAYLLGSKGNIPLNLIYELDLNNGNILSEYDVYEILVRENPEIKPYLDTLKNGFFINSIDYLDDSLLISIRNLNTIMCLDTKYKNIKWILSSSKEIKKYYPQYLKEIDLKLQGNHHAKFINSNKISVFNNGYDYSGTNEPTNASAFIYDLSKNKIAKQYSIDKYAYAYGSIEVASTTIINYAYLLKDLKEDPQNISNTYSEIVEYSQDKVITKLTIDAPIYRAKIININIPKTYTIKEYTYLSNYEEVNVPKITNPKDINNILKIYNNSIETTISDDVYKELIVVFKGKKQYNIRYQKSKTYFSIEDGYYDIYLYMDDNWYKVEEGVKIGE